MAYIVFIDNNFYYMDEETRSTFGRFETSEAAISRYQKIVDEYLVHLHKPDMTPTEMFEADCRFGDNPFIIPEGAPVVEFSAWSYAEQRAAEIFRLANPA